MPKVVTKTGVKHFPYTKKGKALAKRARVVTSDGYMPKRKK